MNLETAIYLGVPFVWWIAFAIYTAAGYARFFWLFD
jgi:hypothetical protein